MPSLSSTLRSFLNRQKNVVDYKLVAPICSAIEGKNLKLALLLVNKTIKASKQSNAVLLALKCITLSQISKHNWNEIRVIIEGIMLSEAGSGAGKGGGGGLGGLGEVEVLTLLNWTLIYLDQQDAMLPILERATQNYPDDEDIALEAFVHFLRVGETRLAQRIGIKLQRIAAAETKYAWWSITTSLLLASELKEDSNPGLILSIAERTLELCENGRKGDQKGKGKENEGLRFQSIETFHLVARMLELRVLTQDQSKVNIITKAETNDSPTRLFLQHFSSGEGKTWCERGLGLEIWRRESELQYGSLKGGEWNESWNRLRQSLEAGDANWHTMLYLIRITFAIVFESTPPTESGLALLDQTRSLFRSLVDGNKIERGYLLGLLEIERECRQRDWTTGESSLLMCQEYFEAFGSKMCCFDDLKPYFDLLNVEESLALSTGLAAEQAVTEMTAKVVQRSINALKITRFIDLQSLSVVQEEEAATAHLERYFLALPLGRDLPVTELQPADDFALLAAQAYISAWSKSYDRTYLEKAAFVLHLAVTHSRYKYQIRILLVLTLRLLGASSLALANYKLLGVKSIQFDTLSHLILNRASTYAVGGTTASDSGVMGEGEVVNAWYKNGESEAGDMIVKALSLGSYSRVEEFTVFARRLKFSLSKCLTRLETLRMRLVRGGTEMVELMTEFERLDLVVRKDSGILSDNRDFNTLPNLQAKVAESIWKSSEMGSRIGVNWLRAMCNVYRDMLLPVAEVVSAKEIILDELTPSELSLYHYSKTVAALYDTPIESIEEPETGVISFFKNQAAIYESAVDNSSTLLWEIIHIVEITFEGYCLLDLSIERKTFELSKMKPVDHAQRTKRLRTLRNTARELVRDLGGKLSSYGKIVAKSRPKVIAALVDLKQYDSVDDDLVLNFAHSLVEARKLSIEGLATGIIKRCAK